MRSSRGIEISGTTTAGSGPSADSAECAACGGQRAAPERQAPAAARMGVQIALGAQCWGPGVPALRMCGRRRSRQHGGRPSERPWHSNRICQFQHLGVVFTIDRYQRGAAILTEQIYRTRPCLMPVLLSNIDEQWSIAGRPKADSSFEE